MHPGVEVEASKNTKDEIQIFGNSLENVSQSAADIQQICKVRDKDIRKVSDAVLLRNQYRPRKLTCLTVLGRHLRVRAGQYRERGIERLHVDGRRASAVLGVFASDGLQWDRFFSKASDRGHMFAIISSQTPKPVKNKKIYNLLKKLYMA